MIFDDVITKSSFRTASDGKRIFFPYGAFGKGRIVDSEITYQKILRHQTIWLFIATFVASIIRYSRLLFIAAILITGLINYITTQMLIKNLAISDVRITWSEIKNNLSALYTFSAFTNYFMIFAGMIISFFGVFAFASCKSTNDLFVCIMVISMGIGIMALSLYSMNNKRAQQSVTRDRRVT